MLNDYLIKENLGQFFKGYKIKDASLFRVLRDSELEIDEGFAPDLLKALKDMTADYALLCGDGVTADNETPQLSAARSLLARLEAR